MPKMLARLWIPAMAFGAAALLAYFAGPSHGASARSSMDTTGKRYHCVKRCEPGGEPCETQVSDTPLDGWECEEKFPVNFYTGFNAFNQQDLSTGGLSRFFVSRMYLQDPSYADHGLGPCWRVGWLYRVIQSGTNVMVISGNDPVSSFTDNGNGTYTADFNYLHTLTTDAVNHLLVLTDTKGKQWKFFDFSGNWNPARRGRFKEYDDKGGNITTTVYGTSGVTTDQILEVQQTDTNPNLFNRFTFGYNSSGASVGLLASINYSQFNTGVSKLVRVANYTYYTSSGTNGPAGTLRKVVITDGSNALDTSYYRYNAADAGGFVPLRYAVQPRGYDRLVAALTVSLGHAPSDAEIDAAADSTIATYADYFFVYDASRRVTQETVQGQGCGCGTSGSRGIFNYAYATSLSPTADAPNVWRKKTTVTLPNGNLRIVFTNSIGQSMLDVFKDSTSGLQWCKYFVFNADYSLAAVAFPSAVSGYAEATDALVSSAQLPDGTGLWHLVDYYATTNLPAGAVAKYVQNKKLRQGETGTPILQETFTFTSRTGSAGTVYPLASRTQYRNTDGTGAQVTSFTYNSWQGTSTQFAQMTITNPSVPTNQNGSASATTSVVQADVFGRFTSRTDEDGFVSTTAYDTLTGAVTQRAVDTATLNLVTNYRVDLLGRATKETDPLGQITYTVYNDPLHQQRVYPGWTGTATTGPTMMSREDRAGGYYETLRMSAAPHITGVEPDGTENVGNLQSLAREYTDTGSRVVYTDSYFYFTGLTYSTAANIGTQGTHFYRRSFNYDVEGHKDREVDWTGTIRRNFYDSRDRVQSSWIGTNDTPASGDWSPTNNTAPSNMIKVTSREFDSNGVGDGNLTKSSVYTSPSTTLDTFYQSDFRGRLSDHRGPDNVAQQSNFDNLDQVTQVQVYADANQNFVIDSGELRGKSQTNYDERGRTYQSTRYYVDPSAGALGDSLTTNYWSNGRGLQVKTRGPNGEFQKTQYDGAGRTKVIFVSFDDAETTYADALTVTGDRVVDETVSIYDAASNIIQTTRYQRTSGTNKTGDLATSWAAADSRRTFVAFWFDKANRRTDVVIYGTNGGSNLSRPSSAPAPNTSDNYLVTHTEFDAGGRRYRTTDNLARVTQRTFDGLDRTTQIVENFTGSGISVETDLDVNRTTNIIFDSSGRLSQRVALNPKGTGLGVQSQTTTYVYGTVANLASPASYRNDVLVAEINPDSDDTYNPAQPAGSQLANGADGVYDRVEYTFDYAGRKSTTMDQRGAMHTYGYDSVGRLSSDTVTTLPSGVDGGVRRLGTDYDSLSRTQLRSSYSDTGGTTLVNQVKITYDGWGNAIKDEQDHAGAVVPGTTPAYQIAYADGGSGGVGKYVRPVSMTYPNGRLVYFNYPTAGSTSVGDHISRIDNIANDAAGTSIFAQYKYLGMGVFGRVDIAGQGNLWLDVDAGGNPAQWDRFGRILSHNWHGTSTFRSFDLDRHDHVYDRVSNRLTRNLLSNGAPSNRDQFYAYDGLQRLTKMNRGALSSNQITDANANFSQKWTALESLGNWRGYQVAPTGANNYTFQQSRSHNSANEIDTDNNDANAAGNSISGIGGADWLDPTYDKAGNLTSYPQIGAETTRQWATYDAWNRLVKVQADSSGSPGATIAEYQFDARNWRVVKLLPNGANWNRTDYYYTSTWQCVEERTLTNTPSKTTVATVPKFQWVWDLRSVDAVLTRDENKDGDSSCTGAADQKLYYLQDANFNTTMLTSSTSAERYFYDSYGNVTVMDSQWASQSPTLLNNEILFAGYRKDPETQLYHVRNRTYHSTLGRWLQRDPSGYVDGNSVYEYVRSQPTVASDPLGLAEWKVEPAGPYNKFDVKTGTPGIAEKQKDTWDGWYSYLDTTKGNIVTLDVDVDSTYSLIDHHLVAADVLVPKNKAEMEGKVTFECDKSNGNWKVTGELGGNSKSGHVYATLSMSYTIQRASDATTINISTAMAAGWAGDFQIQDGSSVSNPTGLPGSSVGGSKQVTIKKGLSDELTKTILRSWTCKCDKPGGGK